MPAGQGIVGWVFANEEPAIVEDPAGDDRFYHGVDEKTGFETTNLLAAPMRTRERTIGVIEVINKRSGAFVYRDVEVAVALAGQAVLADFLQHRVLHQLLLDHLAQLEAVELEQADHLHQARGEDLLLRHLELEFGIEAAHD